MTTTKRNLYPAIGILETTYSDGWERDDPITIAAFDSGECCCPGLRRLPNGDLVVGVGRGGDIHFADNDGDHAAWFRSCENGATWAADHEFRPPYGKLFIRGNTVRCYDGYSFAVKGSHPRRYICRYAESSDGGRTYATHGISTYDTLGSPEACSPYLAGSLAGGAHGKPNIGPWREILAEAGWTGDDWAYAPVGGVTSDGLDHHGWLELPDGSLLTCHSAAKWADWRSGNTAVSRSTDGGISWEFVARVNPECYERVEGYMSGWENLAIEELPTGELLIVYDVQNWIETPGVPPRKAIRAVRMRRKAGEAMP